MSETTDTTAHEAYAFACMRCGHGWEQAYDIEHHVDVSGRQFVVYKADGRRVPSPLSTPSCANCGGHVVRIMRSGRVSSVRQLLAGGMGVTATGVRPTGERTVKPRTAPVSAVAGTAAAGTKPVTERTARPAPEPGSGATPAPGTAAEPHHWHLWHLSDLLHPFHRR